MTSYWTFILMTSYNQNTRRFPYLMKRKVKNEINKHLKYERGEMFMLMSPSALHLHSMKFCAHACNTFSKIDFSQGYHQIVLDENPRDITSFSSPKWLFHYKTLTFWCKNTFKDFNQIVETMITRAINGASNISDDASNQSVSKFEVFLGLLRFAVNLFNNFFHFRTVTKTRKTFVWERTKTFVWERTKPLCGKGQNLCVGKDKTLVWERTKPLCGKGQKPLCRERTNLCVGKDKPLCGKGRNLCVGKDKTFVWERTKPLCGKEQNLCVGKDKTFVWERTKPCVGKDKTFVWERTNLCVGKDKTFV